MVSPLGAKAKELAADLRQRITFEPAGSKYILRLADDSRIHEVLEGELRPVLEAFTAQAERIAELERGMEPHVQSFRVENGELNMALTGPAMEHIAVCVVDHFKAMGAENYFEMSLFDRDDPAERYVVTVQKASAKSPHELRSAAEAEVRTLREVLIKTGRNLGAGLADNVSNEFLTLIPEEAALVRAAALRAKEP